MEQAGVAVAMPTLTVAMICLYRHYANSIDLAQVQFPMVGINEGFFTFAGIYFGSLGGGLGLLMVYNILLIFGLVDVIKDAQ